MQLINPPEIPSSAQELPRDPNPSRPRRPLSLHNLPTPSRPIIPSLVRTNPFEDTSFYLSCPLLCIPDLCEYVLWGIDPAGRSENGKDEDESAPPTQPITL